MDLSATIIGLIIVFGVILVSMILHELSHGLVAYWLGDDTAKLEGRLTLNPIKHLDPFMSLILPLVLYILGGPVFGGAKPVPINTRNLKFREWGMALVAIAGPLTNFLLAFLAFVIGHFTGFLYGTDIMAAIFQNFLFINLGFCIFNILPIPPLDGSRILYAIAPDGARVFLANMERVGLIVVYALILILGSVFSQFMYGAMNGILGFFRWIVGA